MAAMDAAAAGTPAGTLVMQEQLDGVMQGISTMIDAKISEAKSEIFSQITESDRRMKEEVVEMMQASPSSGLPTGDGGQHGQ